MFLRLASAALASLLLPAIARAQCHEFAHDFAQVGVNGSVNAYATFDDGSGPALYIAGGINYVDEQLVGAIARWDGTRWTPVGPTLFGAAYALAVYDDGGGPALYVGGGALSAGGVQFGRVAKWDGTSWSPAGAAGPGPNGAVYALCTYDDGTGAKLYAGGNFQQAGGQQANNLARFDSGGWEAFTSGIDGYAFAMAVYDEGSGPRLVVSGTFTQCGSFFCSNVAQFDGNAFAPLGSGTNGTTNLLQVYDDGSGPALIAAGSFTHAGGNYVSRIASWRNGSWSSLGGGVGDSPRSLAVFDEGAGERLFVGGSFLQAGGQPIARFARWDGAGWSAVGAGDELATAGAAQPVLWAHDDGNGPALYLSTDVRIGASDWTHGIARWTGSAYEHVGTQRNNVLDDTVEGFAVCDDGSGPALYAAGSFVRAGGNTVDKVARWNGTRWSGVGGGFPGLTGIPGLTAVDHGAGPILYAHVRVPSIGGDYSQLRRWNGNSWTTLGGTSPGSLISGMGAYDDGNGPALYVGGNFHSIGGIAATGIARFDGSNWSAVGGGVDGANPEFGPSVFGVHDDGSGPVLVVAGIFESAGGQPALNIARWDGTTWSAFGAGLQSAPTSLATFDDGTGPKLFAGAGPAGQGSLQRWDGNAWGYLPSGPDNWVYALAVFDDGSGPALYVGGRFSWIGNLYANSLARWNGSSWSTVGGGAGLGGTPGTVRALQVFDDGTGGAPDLFVGGDFNSTGGVRSNFAGKWTGCGAPIASFCHGDGAYIPCPCWHNGAPGRGCANSANASGAQLAWSGATNPDTLVLHASGELPSSLSIVLQGPSQGAHVFFGDGLRCVAGTLKRLYVRNASGGSVDAPIAGEPSITARSAALGDTILAGTARYYQVYYRDPQLAFCAAPQGSSFNITNGVVVNW